MSKSEVEKLAELQRALLANGFACLAPGGTLVSACAFRRILNSFGQPLSSKPDEPCECKSCEVYSTCSFARAQNEDIVAQLLDEQPRAKLLPIDGAGAKITAAALRAKIDAATIIGDYGGVPSVVSVTQVEARSGGGARLHCQGTAAGPLALPLLLPRVVRSSPRGSLCSWLCSQLSPGKKVDPCGRLRGDSFQFQ